LANHSLLALAHFIVDIDRAERGSAVEQAKLPESARLEDRNDQQSAGATMIKAVHS